MSIKWTDPLDLAYQISISSYNQNWLFLYSGLFSQIPNSKSYICLYPSIQIIADDFQEIEKSLRASNEKYFGYFGYELKNCLENLKASEKSFINLPNLWLMKFAVVLEFDHDKKEIRQFGFSKEFNDLKLGTKNENPKVINEIEVKNLKSNFSKSAYLEKLESIQKNITDGEIYQANLTRKFFGELRQEPENPFEVFLKLNKASPANYSSFLKIGDSQIISSSPELFLKIDENNQVISRPIKGTAKRFADKELDCESKENLKNSPKEQAENLMIVDLVRNDLSKNCRASSVEVKNLFKISSYKTLHHLSSEIIGIKEENSSNLDVLKSCFPAGSMTGAPKIRAMEICADLEKQNRGIYSGAIGFIGNDSCQLSVVIRTLILQKNKFEFQVGGAITFDSIPQSEWQETISKSKGIAKTLGIRLADLERI
ncbi:MAG: para-aminobenzoate synthetase component 1 [Rickettsiales bacterium]|jgi:para-aminobenzoate synthetase component 1